MCYEVLHQFMEQEGMHSMEGSRGLRNLDKIAKTLGYCNLHQFPLLDFLEDNSGAIDSIITWMGKQKSPEWEAALRAALNAPIEEQEA